MGTSSSIEKSFGTTDISNFQELFNKSATSKDEKNKNIKLMTESDFYKHFPIASTRDLFGYKQFTVFDIDGSRRIDFEEFFNAVTIFLDHKSDRKVSCLYTLMTDNQNIELGRDKLVDFLSKAVEYANKTFHSIDSSFNVETLFADAKKVVKDDVQKDDTAITLTADKDVVAGWIMSEKNFKKFVLEHVQLRNVVDSVFSLSQSHQVVEEVRNGYEQNVQTLIVNMMPLDDTDLLDRQNALEWYWQSIQSRRLILENPNKAMEMEAKQQSLRRKSVGAAEGNVTVDINAIMNKYTAHVADDKLLYGVQLTMEQVNSMEDNIVRQASQFNRLANVEKLVRKTKKDFLLELNRTKSEDHNQKLLESLTDKVRNLAKKRLPAKHESTQPFNFKLTVEQCHQILGVPVAPPLLASPAPTSSSAKAKKKTRSRANSAADMDMPPSLTAHQTVPYPIESPLMLEDTTSIGADVLFAEIISLIQNDYLPCVRGPAVLKPLVQFLDQDVRKAIDTALQSNITEACGLYTNNHFKQYNADIAMLYNKFAEYRTLQQSHEAEYDDARIQISKVTLENDQLTTENEQMKTQLRNLQAQVDALTTKSSELQCVKEIAMQNLYEEMLFHEKEKQTWDRLKKTHEEDIQTLQQSNLTLENEARQAKLQKQQNCCTIM